MKTAPKSQLLQVWACLRRLKFRDSPDPFSGYTEREWVHDGFVVARGNNGMSPEVMFLAPVDGRRFDPITGRAALFLMDIGAARWTDPIKQYSSPHILLVGRSWYGVTPWSNRFIPTVVATCVAPTEAVGYIETHPNVVGVIIDDTGMSDEESRAFADRLAEAGYCGAFHRVKDGEAIIRASLAEYMKPLPQPAGPPAPYIQPPALITGPAPSNVTA
jgi:hypothetical protein